MVAPILFTVGEYKIGSVQHHFCVFVLEFFEIKIFQIFNLKIFKKTKSGAGQIVFPLGLVDSVRYSTLRPPSVDKVGRKVRTSTYFNFENFKIKISAGKMVAGTPVHRKMLGANRDDFSKEKIT